jgi:hypothetical protein
LQSNIPVSKQLGNNAEFQTIDQRALASVVDSLVLSKNVVDSKRKMNNVVRNIVNGIKYEPVKFLQKRNAHYLGLLIHQLTVSSGPENYEKVVNKVITNLVVFLTNNYTESTSDLATCYHGKLVK